MTSRSDLVGGAMWAGFGALVIAESLRMERFTAMGGTLYTMPGLVPGLLGGLLVVLGGVLAWRGWRQQRTHHAASAADAPARSTPALNRRIAITLVVTLAYAAVMVGRMPFVVSTFLFVALFTWLFTPADTPPVRRAAAAVVSGAVTTAAIVLVFEHIFLVRLP
jgi:hypothetical protein